MVFPGNFDSLEPIRVFFAQAAREAGFNENTVYDIQMAVDEAAANIIDHAYGGENLGDIECAYEIQPSGLVVYLYDHGLPFDPEEIEEPDLLTDVCQRKSRGLGLYFMRKMMDEVHFDLNGQGGNVLVMRKNFEKEQG